MSTKEVYDYVMNTPKNTNPAVLSSMLGHLSWNDLKDKPFYTENNRILCVSAIVPVGTHKAEDCIISNAIEVGKTYTVNFNGAEYKEVAVYCDGFVGLGNGSYDEWYQYQTDAPFWFEFTDNGTYIYASEEGLPITVYWGGEVVHQVPPKYIPNSAWVEEETLTFVENMPMDYYDDTYSIQVEVNTGFSAGDIVTLVLSSDDGQESLTITGAIKEEKTSYGDMSYRLETGTIYVRCYTFSNDGEILLSVSSDYSYPYATVIVTRRAVKTNCDLMVTGYIVSSFDETETHLELTQGDYQTAKRKILMGLPVYVFSSVDWTEKYEEGDTVKYRYSDILNAAIYDMDTSREFLGVDYIRILPNNTVEYN